MSTFFAVGIRAEQSPEGLAFTVVSGQAEAMRSSSPILRLSDLTLVRGTRVLVQDMDLEIRAGEIWAIEGANGAGKTTILRAAAGLFRPFLGQVHRASQTSLRYLGHQLALKSEQTPAQVLSQDHLASWQLSELANLPIQHLSTGQRKRVALAQRCRPGAQLWVFDEPLANLDTQQQARFKAVLRAHARAGGAALVSVHAAVLGGHRLRIEDRRVRRV